MKNYIKYIGILALGMVACEPEFENPVDANDAYTSGEADFSNFVAIGNSITSGYADNALYISAQEASYPNIMAQQFAKVGGGDFTQPLMADNYGGFLIAGEQRANTRLVLAFDNEGNPMPKNLNETPTTEITNVLSGPFNNMGVPGMKSFHLFAEGYGNAANLEAGTANPYFVRFASAPNATILGDAVAQNPTFFSLWIGKNDILSFATSGGTGIAQTGNLDASSYDSDDITDSQLFAGVYSQVVDALIAAGAEEGVVNAVPDVTVAPFFTRVPYAPLDPTNPEFGPMIPTLNASFAGLNQIISAVRNTQEFDAEGNKIADTEFTIEFDPAGASPLVIKDESLTDISAQIKGALMQAGYPEAVAEQYGQQYGQVRQATPGDRVLLTSASAISEIDMEVLAAWMAVGLSQEEAGQLSVRGITLPMADRYVLTTDEVEILNTARTQFNTAIQGIAQSKGLAYVDVNEIIQELASGGIPYDEGTLTAEFATGGAFSLDGIHLTPRASALLANRMIDAINETYGATVPKVNISNYGTITVSNNVAQ
ncbi:GDSL-like Lipase/Acylhydrolase [Salinimicrobium catena]|uniref:GDSL-like Lipase/Acylhydrolase n=1 Tax=Salinimicrobium catena TaxID=390640 RepID=A0A1H5H2J1_9FLAO|nr:G-D-S-L family lipolytic protein [Salinimicrobium catena]SDK67230.1 GDSL-like Lipase/Acylhydrolase [Salinimicrobium catena]SEE21974.1 GDSL-like Lipase/Acylhydrolase [Salinimicrobium catena]